MMKLKASWQKYLAAIEHSDWVMPALSVVLGAVLFLFIYGASVLNVTNDAWLMNASGDLSAHYEGWLFFRASAWHFPLGLIDGITYPHSFSVVYMDSIPILAVFFKLLSPILPATFQYIGIYGLLTYILQAFLGYKIIYQKTKNKYAGFVGSIFFTLSSTMLQRMFGHEALAFHPILLMAIYIYIKKAEYKEKKLDVLLWSALLALACTIQAYFVPMVFVFILAFYCDEIITRKWYMALLKIIVPVILLVFTMYLFGYFYGTHELSAGGLGDFNSNLNVLFNDMGTSYFDYLLGKKSTGIWESYAYLGFGAIVISFLAILGMIRKKQYKAFSKKYIPTVLLISAFVVMAVQPSVKLGNHLFFKIEYSENFANMLSTFRANGRFMWPIMYLIMCFGIAYVVNHFKRFGMFLLVLCAVFQIADFRLVYTIKRDNINTWETMSPALTSKEWNAIDKDEIYFFYNPVGGGGDFYTLYGLGKYAYDNNMVMNDFYASRKDDSAISADRNTEHKKVLNGATNENRLYVFADIPTEFLGNSSDIHIYRLDGLIIGVSEEVQGLKRVSFQDGINLLDMMQSFVKNGKDVKESEPLQTEGDGSGPKEFVGEANGRHIFKGGCSLGPYITIPAGKYHVECTGDNLDNGEYTVTSDHGVHGILVKNLSIEDNLVSYDIELAQGTSVVEFCVTNTEDGEILLKDMILSGTPSD